MMSSKHSVLPALGPILLCLSVLVSPALGGTPDVKTPPKAESSTPKLESAEAQLKHAASVRTAIRGTDGDARTAARKAAVEAYRAVREYFAQDAPACAEASFRAAELLRGSSDLPGAMAEFKLARERGAGTPWRVRAMLEIAHLERRTKHETEALTDYEAVIGDESADARQKDEALLWAGRVYTDLARPADAKRVWQRVADGGEDPLDRIKAFDYMAQALVEAGDLEGAAGMIERCRESLSEEAQEESRLGERVRSALAGMRAQDELARALEKKKGERQEGKSKNGEKPVKKTGEERRPPVDDGG